MMRRCAIPQLCHTMQGKMNFPSSFKAPCSRSNRGAAACRRLVMQEEKRRPTLKQHDSFVLQMR